MSSLNQVYVLKERQFVNAAATNYFIKMLNLYLVA